LPLFHFHCRGPFSLAGSQSNLMIAGGTGARLHRRFSSRWPSELCVQVCERGGDKGGRDGEEPVLLLQSVAVLARALHSAATRGQAARCCGASARCLLLVARCSALFARCSLLAARCSQAAARPKRRRATGRSCGAKLTTRLEQRGEHCSDTSDYNQPRTITHRSRPILQ